MVSSTDKAFNLLVLLQQAMDAYYNARNKELSPYGISSREAATLHAICSIGKTVTPAKLARWVYRKPQTITAILNRMQKRSYHIDQRYRN
jgi:DNA-binding MarR family transcriptional regulator